MKNIIYLALVIILLGSIAPVAYSQENAKVYIPTVAANNQIGRFRITMGGINNENILLLDTATGQTWRASGGAWVKWKQVEFVQKDDDNKK